MIDTNKLSAIELAGKKYVLLVRNDDGVKSIVWKAAPLPDQLDEELANRLDRSHDLSPLQVLRETPAPVVEVPAALQEGPFVALKVAKSEAEITDLLGEAKLLRQFADPSWRERGQAQIIAICEPYPTPELPVLVEPWVTGVQMDQLAQPFEERKALEIALQLARLLSTLYRTKSVTLTDTIKPNSLFWDEGQQSLILIDWNVMGTAADFQAKSLPIFGDTLFTLLTSRPILNYGSELTIVPAQLEAAVVQQRFTYGTLALLRRTLLREFSGKVQEIALALYEAVQEMHDLWLKTDKELLDEAKGLTGEAAVRRYSLPRARTYLPNDGQAALLRELRAVVAELEQRGQTRAARLTLAWARNLYPRDRALRWQWLAHTAADEDAAAQDTGQQVLTALATTDIPGALTALGKPQEVHLRALSAELACWQKLATGQDCKAEWQQVENIWTSWQRGAEVDDLAQARVTYQTALDKVQAEPFDAAAAREACAALVEHRLAIATLSDWIKVLDSGIKGEWDKALEMLRGKQPDEHPYAGELRECLVRQITAAAQAAVKQDCWRRAVRLVQAIATHAPDTAEIQVTSTLDEYQKRAKLYGELQKQVKDLPTGEAQVQAYEAWLRAGFEYETDGETPGRLLRVAWFESALTWAEDEARRGQYDKALKIVQEKQSRLTNADKAVDESQLSTLHQQAHEAIQCYTKNIEELTEKQRNVAKRKLSEAKELLKQSRDWQQAEAINRLLVEVMSLIKQALQFDEMDQEAAQAKMAVEAFRDGRLELQLAQELAHIPPALEKLKEAVFLLPAGWEAPKGHIEPYLQAARSLVIEEPLSVGSELKVLAARWKAYAAPDSASAASIAESWWNETKECLKNAREKECSRRREAFLAHLAKLRQQWTSLSAAEEKQQNYTEWLEALDSVADLKDAETTKQQTEIVAQCKPDLAESFALLATEHLRRGYKDKASQVFDTALEYDPIQARVFVFKTATAWVTGGRYPEAEAASGLVSEKDITGPVAVAREALCNVLTVDLHGLWQKHLSREDVRAVEQVYVALEGARGWLVDTYLYPEAQGLSETAKQKLAHRYDAFIRGESEISASALVDDLVQYKPDDVRDEIVLSPDRLVPLVEAARYGAALTWLGTRVPSQALCKAVQKQVEGKCCKLLDGSRPAKADLGQDFAKLHQLINPTFLGQLQDLAERCPPEGGSDLDLDTQASTLLEALEKRDRDSLSAALAAVPVAQWPALYTALEEELRKNRLGRRKAAQSILLAVLLMVGVVLGIWYSANQWSSWFPLVSATPTPETTGEAPTNTRTSAATSEPGDQKADETLTQPVIRWTLGKGELLEGGAVVSYTLTLTNTGDVAAAPTVSATESVNVDIEVGTEWSSVPVTLPELAQGDTAQYSVRVYRRLEEGQFAQVPEFDLEVNPGEGTGLMTVPVPPVASLTPTVMLTVSTSPLTMSLPSMVSGTLAANLPGAYAVHCVTETSGTQLDCKNAQPVAGDTWTYTVTEAGPWTAYACPVLPEGHPDRGETLSPVSSTPFTVTAAQYGIEVVAVENPDNCRLSKCPDGISDAVIVIQNTGNLPDTPRLAYYNLKNTLAMTLTAIETTNIVTPDISISEVFTQPVNGLSFTLTFTPTEGLNVKDSNVSRTVTVPLEETDGLPPLAAGESMTLTFLIQNNFLTNERDYKPELALLIVPGSLSSNESTLPLICEERDTIKPGSYCLPAEWAREQTGQKEKPLPVVWVGQLN